MQAQESHRLMVAIENEGVAQVRQELEAEREMSDAVLTAPSLVEEHGFRTPLMAAVMRGDLPILTALMRRLERRFSKKDHKKCWQVVAGESCPQEERDGEMRTQLEIQDAEGKNLGMLATRCGNVAILKAVMTEIIHTGATHVLDMSDFEGYTLLMHAASVGSAPVFRVVYQTVASALVGGDEEGMHHHLTRCSGDGRTILMHAARSGNAMALSEVVEACRSTCDPGTIRHLLYQTDADGMNFLMHSATALNCREARSEVVADSEANRATPRPRASFASREAAAAAAATALEELHLQASRLELGEADVQRPDSAVPVFNVAIAVITECLWKDQRRVQLTAADLWGRTVLTHAIRSGHEQLFDAVLRAVRQDVLDSEVEEMLDTGEDKVENMPLRSALVEGGKEMQTLFGKRRRQLKGDIGLRAKLSSIEAKIQSFIPGKLIVIFQLLLPETNRASRQLLLLIIMCVLAPILNWAGSLVTTERPNPNDPRSKYRKSKVSLFLGAPALFFWGVGITSSIGLEIGWNESLSAALLAVATIVIPAVDAFFNSQQIELWYEKLTCQKQVFVLKANREWRRKEKRPSPLERKDGRPPVRHEMSHILRHSDTAAPASETLDLSASCGRTGKPAPLTTHPETKEDE
eukprot:g11646.t1